MALTPQKISARTPLTSTGRISRPAARQGSTTEYRTVDNFTATVDPAVTDDVTDGYHAGSEWYNTTDDRYFICKDPTDGAAVWRRIMADDLAGVSAAAARGNLSAWARLWKPFLTGTYHWPFGYSSGTSGAPVGSRVHLIPIIMPVDVTVSDLFIRIGTGAAGNWQAAIYNSHASTYKPTTLVAKSNASTSSAGSAAVTASGGLNTSPTLLEGVLYYFAFNTDTSTPTYTACSYFNSLFNVSTLIGSTTLSNMFNSGPLIGYYVDTVTLGTWDDLTAATFVEAANIQFPLIGYKVA